MSEPKKVLLSYVADTQTFVDAFCAPLFDDGGRLRRIEARIDDIPPGMDISTVASERVESADVIISFICEKYGRCPSADDLRLAAQRRRNRGGWPIVVPIILGIDGHAWWEKFQQEVAEAAALRNIADKPFFKPGTNSWVLPNPEDLHVIHGLRDWLCDLVAPPLPSSPSPSPPALPAALPDAVVRIVLLGHPTRSLPEAVGKAAAQVADALAAAGVPVQSWPDGWEGAGVPAAEEQRTVFLQPLAAADAAASARTPSRTENYLVNALGEAARPRIEASPVVLWLPDGERQEEFARSAGQPGEDNPIFRTDTAPALAEWLCRRFGFGRRGPIMACEEIEILIQKPRPEGQARPVDARRQIAEELDRMVYGVPPPEDRLSVWFTASQFEHYFRSVADKRPILMAHDLKMPIPAMQGNTNPVHQLIGKFRTLQAKADQILQEMKLTSDDVFWIACITAEQTVVPPSVRLPNPSVDRWHMLRVERRDTDFAVEQNSRKSVSEGLQSWMGH